MTWHTEIIRLTLSPHIVLLAQVRRVKSNVLSVCHVYDSRTARIKRVSGSNLDGPSSGTWSLKDNDFNRYGRGGLGLIVYATTLLGWTT